MDNNYSVVLFHSTSAAIKAEKVTRKAELNVKLIPVPRHLSSDCGISLRFKSDDSEKIRKIMDAELVEYDSIHIL